MPKTMFYCNVLLDYFSRHILVISMQNIICPIPDLQLKNTPKATKMMICRAARIISLEGLFGAATQFHPPLVCLSCLNSRDWLTDAARKIKHSYANIIIIIISLDSMCVGGGGRRIENLDISISTTSFPPSEEVEVRYLLGGQSTRGFSLLSLSIYLSIPSLSCMFLSLHPIFGEKQAGQSLWGYKVSTAG